MLEFLTPIGTPLWLSNPDVVIAFLALVFFGIFAFLGSAKAYSAFYGAALWVGIYVVLQTLLGPGYQSADTAKILSPGVSKFLIGSSAYLIPILYVLGPVNGALHIKATSNPVARAFESGAVAIFATVLVITSAFGFMSKTYVFTADTAFTLLKESASFMAFFGTSKALTYLAAHMQAIVVSAILFWIYRAFFADIVSAAVVGAFSAIMKRAKKASVHEDHGHDDHGGHDDHDDHGHDGEGHDDHGGHDDHDDHGGHGHGGHGHGGHGHH